MNDPIQLIVDKYGLDKNISYDQKKDHTFLVIRETASEIVRLLNKEPINVGQKSKGFLGDLVENIRKQHKE